MAGCAKIEIEIVIRMQKTIRVSNSFKFLIVIAPFGGEDMRSLKNVYRRRRNIE